MTDGSPAGLDGLAGGSADGAGLAGAGFFGGVDGFAGADFFGGVDGFFSCAVAANPGSMAMASSRTAGSLGRSRIGPVNCHR